ncbi:class I SAM-dependent methyltransferase [Flexibacterium corallicola]|uniref:class I SAM-dependent methyltransferase n=1 Tax=Flexibacterium corallicola TaxID=3037259 RepID=UPI00286F476D|nr:class I SAM-dependent methyltransferase [Pseudovibrio sp. M1P-2-3]
MQRELKNGGSRKTNNNYGLSMNCLSKASRDFISFASQLDKPSIDMGCAYGVATRPLLDRGKTVFACDLSPNHLQSLREETPPRLSPFLRTQAGCFPQDFEFEDGSIGAIHCSLLFHFLTGEQVMDGLAKFRRWLCDEGRLFINVGTPKNPYLGNFPAEYEKRKGTMKWPGEISGEELSRFVLPEFIEWMGHNTMFRFVHRFDKDILSRALTSSGFHINELYAYTLEVNGKLHEFMGDENHLSAVASIR